LIKDPLAAGLVTWLGCYCVGFAIYWICSDFTFLEGAPVYVPSADPKASPLITASDLALGIVFARTPAMSDCVSMEGRTWRSVASRRSNPS
jgi:hypothetical protein